MAKISKDQSVGNLHPRETLVTIGNIGALNAELLLAADGANSIALDLRGTFSMTLEVAGTVDGTNWTLIPMRPVNQAAIIYVAAIAGAAAGTWVGKCGPFKTVRVRCTAYTSGAAAAAISADTAVIDDSLTALVTGLIVTTTAAISTATTFVAPLTTGVIWRLTAGYYVAP
jgi:hypothetical protein